MANSNAFGLKFPRLEASALVVVLVMATAGCLHSENNSGTSGPNIVSGACSLQLGEKDLPPYNGSISVLTAQTSRLPPLPLYADYSEGILRVAADTSQCSPNDEISQPSYVLSHLGPDLASRNISTPISIGEVLRYSGFSNGLEALVWTGNPEVATVVEWGDGPENLLFGVLLEGVASSVFVEHVPNGFLISGIAYGTLQVEDEQGRTLQIDPQFIHQDAATVAFTVQVDESGNIGSSTLWMATTASTQIAWFRIVIDGSGNPVASAHHGGGRLFLPDGDSIEAEQGLILLSPDDPTPVLTTAEGWSDMRLIPTQSRDGSIGVDRVVIEGRQAGSAVVIRDRNGITHEQDVGRLAPAWASIDLEGRVDWLAAFPLPDDAMDVGGSMPPSLSLWGAGGRFAASYSAKDGTARMTIISPPSIVEDTRLTPGQLSGLWRIDDTSKFIALTSIARGPLEPGGNPVLAHVAMQLDYAALPAPFTQASDDF